MSENTKRHVFVLAMIIEHRKTEQSYLREQHIWFSDNKVLLSTVASKGWEITPIFCLQEQDFKDIGKQAQKLLKSKFENHFNDLSLDSKRQIAKKWQTHFEALDLPVGIKNQVEVFASDAQEDNAPIHPFNEGIFLSPPYQGDDKPDLPGAGFIEQEQMEDIWFEHGMSPIFLLGELVDNIEVSDQKIWVSLVNEMTSYLLKTSKLVPVQMRIKLDEIIEVEKLLLAGGILNEKQRRFN